MSRHHKSTSGVTLLELLAVMAIIGILVSLLLGAVHKAHARVKDRVWRLEAPGFIALIQERLRKFYQSQTSYPAWTADDLYRRNVFDDRIMGFLRSPNVTFIPFSSTDSDDKWILKVINMDKSFPAPILNPLRKGAGPHLSIWRSIARPGRIGSRSVPLRSVSAATSSLGRFQRALACLTAAAWNKPRSASPKLTCAQGSDVDVI